MRNKSNLGKGLFALFGVAMTLVFSAPSQAVPAFARQTGKACATCHFQHYPALNDYGRDFKANGYVAMGKQGTIKGSKDNELSMPDVLNASLFLKIRHQQSNGSDKPNEPSQASGQWQAPDEFALLFGGRITPNIGYMLEGQLANGAAAFVAGFKMPFMYDVAGKKVGVIPFTTDALGAAYGFELLNTGAVRNVRVMEHRNESSAQQYIGTATPAMGAAFIISDPSWFINFSRWSPNHAATAEGLTGGAPSSNYLRLAYTPSVGDWDVGVGAQFWGGSSRRDDGTGSGTDQLMVTKAWALDAQAQGIFMNRPLGLYLTHANAAAQNAGEKNLYNTAKNAKTATTFAVEYGIIPNKATLMLAYRIADNGAAVDSQDNAVTIGGTYQFAQNVQLQFQHSNRSGLRYEGTAIKGNSLTTFMLSSGF
ncbi:MAG: hypothetical protein LAD29_04925 [Rhodoferax sp.]|nr:hypothetical protein [Rhodoferax sp.]